jgi:predicted transcriptional regulator of viral defense system
MYMIVNKTNSGGTILRELRTDAALRQLIVAGPVVVAPDFEPWVLRQLVRTGRIARLRRGVYLVPDAKGRMLPPAAVAALLDPKGYLSFYGALILHGLTDQDTSVWAVVTTRRQPSARYGRARIGFVLRRARAPRPQLRTRRLAGVPVRVASAGDAFCDCLERPRYAPSPAELLRILSTGLRSRRLSVRRMREGALRSGSPSVASRLGLLLELATGERDSVLYVFARRSHRWRSLMDEGAVALRDSGWRLTLPASPKQIARAART